MEQQKRIIISHVGNSPKHPHKLTSKDSEISDEDPDKIHARFGMVALTLPSPTSSNEDTIRSPPVVPLPVLNTAKHSEDVTKCLLIRNASGYGTPNKAISKRKSASVLHREAFLLQKLKHSRRSTKTAGDPVGKDINFEVGNLLNPAGITRNIKAECSPIKRAYSLPSCQKRPAQSPKKSPLYKKDPFILSLVEKKKLFVPQKTYDCAFPFKTRSEEERYKQTQILIAEIKRLNDPVFVANVLSKNMRNSVEQSKLLEMAEKLLVFIKTEPTIRIVSIHELVEKALGVRPPRPKSQCSLERHFTMQNTCCKSHDSLAVRRKSGTEVSRNVEDFKKDTLTKVKLKSEIYNMSSPTIRSLKKEQKEVMTENRNYTLEKIMLARHKLKSTRRQIHKTHSKGGDWQMRLEYWGNQLEAIRRQKSELRELLLKK